LGGVYQRQGKFDEAVQTFQQSAKIEEEINNQRGQAMVLNSLGGVYQRQGKFDEAVQTFQQSYELLVNVADERGQAMVLNSLGGVYQRQGKFDEAVQAFQQSYDIGKKLNDRRHLAMVSTSSGRALLKQNMPEPAISHLEEGFEIDRQLRNKRGLGIVTPILCRALQEVGREGDAIEICDHAIKIAPRNHRLLQLKIDIEYKGSKNPKKRGSIKCVIQKESGFRFGFIVPDDGSKEIYFGENQVERALLPKLRNGLRVVAEIEIAPRGPRARRVWGDDD